jgi:hypothetical protein
MPFRYIRDHAPLSTSVNDRILHGGGKFNGRQNQGNENNRSKPDLVSDNDKNHSKWTKWRFKEGKDFAKTFYKNQHQCPKMSDGKSICMKFFM